MKGQLVELTLRFYEQDGEPYVEIILLNDIGGKVVITTKKDADFIRARFTNDHTEAN